ncbi:neural cell adhesion molecule 2-like isoform X2 [Montipora capricornis]
MAHVFQFYLDDVYIGNSSSGVYTVTVTADGAYTCVPVNTVGKEENATVVISTVYAPSVKVHPTSSVVVEGHNITLSCMASGRPEPVLSWTKVGESGQVLSENSFLVLSNMHRPGTLDNMIQYQCTAENGVENLAFAIANITVHYGPSGTTIELTPSNTTVLRGSSLSINCTTDANPMAHVFEFYLDDVYIGNSSSGMYNVTVSADGAYTCVPVNTVGKEENATVVISTVGPPNIIATSANQTVNEGSYLTLNCTISGNPAPNTTWTRLWDNRVVSMPLTNIRRQDKGGYRCTANNGIGNPVSKDVFITVHYQPSITSVTPLTKQSWVGQRVQLKCVADGSPTPSITWKKTDGTELKKVTSTENTVDAQMKSDQDFGNYSCEASNVVGAAALRWVQLNQIKPPESPSLTTNDNDIRASSLTVKWTAPVDDGGSPITGYNLVILHGQNVIRNETTSAAVREYLVDSLNKSTTYTLRVSAMNRVFQGAAIEKRVTTKYEGAPATVEIIGLPSETKNVSVTIKWNKPENNGAPITQYTVYLRIVNIDNTLGEWNKIRVIKGLSRRQVTVELEKNKVYHFAVTATNKHGESLQEGKNIRKLVVLGDVPEPVVIVKADIKDQKVTFAWNKPEENGAAITQYTIYKRNANDQKWTKVAEIKDISNRVFVVEVERMKTYEFVVTATNKYGESSVTKEKIKTVKMPNEGGKYSCSRSYLILIKTIFHVKMIWEINKG